MDEQDFVTVGLADLKDGELRQFEAGGRKVAVAYLEDKLYALDDICTHAACSLSEGDLEGLTVVCPCHQGTYDLRTGEVLDGPPPEGVAIYEVRVQDGDLQIRI
ncbi:MAG: Rieske (2Fe-2S) protein [Actinomycetota bacterium]